MLIQSIDISEYPFDSGIDMRLEELEYLFVLRGLIPRPVFICIGGYICPFAYPGYDWRSQAVSDLSGITCIMMVCIAIQGNLS